MRVFRRKARPPVEHLQWVSAPNGKSGRTQPVDRAKAHVEDAAAYTLLDLAAENAEGVNYVALTGVLTTDAARGRVGNGHKYGTHMAMAFYSCDDHGHPHQMTITVVADPLSSRAMEELKAGRQVLVSGYLAPGSVVRATTVMAAGPDLYEISPEGELLGRKVSGEQ